MKYQYSLILFSAFFISANTHANCDTEPTALDGARIAASDSHNIGLYEWNSGAQAYELIDSWYDSSFSNETPTWNDVVIYDASQEGGGDDGGGGGDNPPTNPEGFTWFSNGNDPIHISSCDEPVELPRMTVTGSVPSSFGPSLRIVSGGGSNSNPDYIFHRRIADVSWEFIDDVDATDHNVDCESSYQARWDAARESIPESVEFQRTITGRRGWYDVYYTDTDHQEWLVTAPTATTLGLDLMPPKPCKTDG